MRIAIVGPTHPIKGGVAQHTTVLAQQARAAGHDVRIVSWRRQYPHRLYPGQQLVSTPEFAPFEPTERSLDWQRPDTWVRAARRLRDQDLVVVAHITPVQVPAYLTMLRVLRRSGTPTAVVAHNVLPHERRRIDVPFVRRLFAAAGRVLVHSEAEGRLARSLTSTPVVVAPIAPFMPEAFVARSPAPGEHRRLLFFGLVRPYKGLDVLLRSLAASGLDDVRLRVAGEFWGGTAATVQLLDELGLTDRVELRPGYLAADQVPGLFADVDALVLPYRTATGSQGPWTAFEFGVPAIVTRAGDLARDVRDGVDGIVAEPDDVADLAAALRRFYAPGEPERLRAAVRPVDPAPYWQDYLAKLTTTTAPREAAR